MALSVIFGGLITILVTVLVEYFRRPKLVLSVEEPPRDVLNILPNRPAHDARHLRLMLRNKPLPRGLRWMQRAAALQCRGEVTFHHLDDGQDKFGRAMAVRWAGSPQPIPSQVVNLEGVVQFVLQDFSRTAAESRMDVYPREEEALDICARFDKEQVAYDWNNDSYLHLWRNPDWALEHGRFLVKVVITSSGQKCIGVFRLINDVTNRMDFRLVSSTPDDRGKVH